MDWTRNSGIESPHVELDLVYALSKENQAKLVSYQLEVIE